MREVTTTFKVGSTAYLDGQKMPLRYANVGVQGGQNVSVPFKWGGLPNETRSIAIVMVDRHPVANHWMHWTVINIPPETVSIAESASGTQEMPPGSRELNATSGKPGYQGPQPPAGSGDHDYETIIYALSVESVELPTDITFFQLERSLEGKVLARASITGLFGR